MIGTLSKRCDRRTYRETDRRRDGQTEISALRAAWLQLKMTYVRNQGFSELVVSKHKKRKLVKFDSAKEGVGGFRATRKHPSAYWELPQLDQLWESYPCEERRYQSSFTRGCLNNYMPLLKQDPWLTSINFFVFRNFFSRICLRKSVGMICIVCNVDSLVLLENEFQQFVRYLCWGMM